MGVDRSFQALPADERLIERARIDRDFGEILSMVFSCFREAGRPSSGLSSPAPEALLQAMREMLARDPGLAARNCLLDSRWDQIHYLLSATRRGRRPEPNDAVLDVALEGEAKIAPHAVGPQGYPLRHTSPAMVVQIDALLAGLDVESLRQHYDMAAMQERGVYKAFAGRESPEDWRYLTTLIGDLQAFYADAARAGNSVPVLTD